MKIIYTGEKVWESHISELMDTILLEALSNCVRHAGASELYVKSGSEEQEWIIVITDNGQKRRRMSKKEEDYPVYEKSGAIWRYIENQCEVKIFDNR